MTFRFAASAAVFALASAGCGPRLVPVMQNGQVLPDRTDAVVSRARAEAEVERARFADDRAVATADALASCAPDICAAVARGELAIGMNEAQVLAATGTTPAAWETRSAAGSTVMAVRSPTIPAADAVGEVVMVTLQDGGVSGYTYREPQGYRTVTSAADATLAVRASAQADALLQQGDAYAAAGRLDLALARYDQADVIRPGHAETNFRLASTLDKQLRPIEAVLRYRLFIHQLEIEKIQARGEAAARMAEAIARARERVIILDQQ
jgi:hypothetical protein